MVAGDGADVWPAMGLAVPLVLLLPACVLFRRRSMTVLAVAGWVVLVPIMDLCLPWRPLLHSFAHGRHLRIVTCNTHGSALDLRAMSDFIDATQPDVVAMQEWGEGFVHPPLGAGRWYELTDGEQRIQSRYPVKRMGPVVDGGWGQGSATRFELQTPVGPVPFFSIHLASPHNAIRSVVQFKSSAGDSVENNSIIRRQQAAMVGLEAGRAGAAIIMAGDFNMPCDSDAYRMNLSEFSDAFSVGGFGFGWTYHWKGTDARIDHVLSGEHWRCSRCWVGPPMGSPHEPLVADLEWVE